MPVPRRSAASPRWKKRWPRPRPRSRRCGQEQEDDPTASDARQKQARQRAAEERADRVKAALERLPELEAKKKPDEKDKARCSTTDPEATVMKMADGGFHPAYNVQFATDTDSQVIVGVDVVTTGSDQGQMPPMVEQIQERYGKAPGRVRGRWWVRASTRTSRRSVPRRWAARCMHRCRSRKIPQVDRHAPHSGDSAAVAAWRRRMGTEEAKAIYKDRAATAECVNA